MKHFKYFIQFLLAILSFFLFKILGIKLSSYLCGKLFQLIGPFFRSEKIIHSNIKRAIPQVSFEELNKITKLMWNNYGRIFSEYMFIKNFRMGKLVNKIEIEGEYILEEIKKSNKQVVFISGHLSNFELMALSLEKSGIKLAAIYRPLNNFFLNSIMETIRKKYICKKQIKKGIGGLKKLIYLKKKNYSTALMIDQRVSEGIKSKLFNKEAYTTTIPGQLVKKFNMPIIPVHIERFEDVNFKIKIHKPIYYGPESSVENITDNLNKILEDMIRINPEQWIWSHNRWK